MESFFSFVRSDDVLGMEILQGMNLAGLSMLWAGLYVIGLMGVKFVGIVMCLKSCRKECRIDEGIFGDAVERGGGEMG